MPDQLLRICAAVEREKKEPEHHGLRLQFAIVAVLGDGGELGSAWRSSAAMSWAPLAAASDCLPVGGLTFRFNG